MILFDVMAEIGEALDVVPDLNVYAHPVDSISPTAAIVQFPNMTFDAAFQRGTDRWEGGILIAVSRVWDRAALTAVSPFVSGSGGGSIHAALRAHDWQTCSFVRATGLTWPSGTTIGGVDYVAAQFALDIAGPGSTT